MGSKQRTTFVKSEVLSSQNKIRMEFSMNFLFCTSTVKSYLNFPFLSLNMSREKNLQFEAGKLDWKIALLYFALIKVIAKCISWNASLKNLKKLRKRTCK